MKTKQKELNKVHTLYMLQMELVNFLNKQEVDKKECRQIEKSATSFSTLLPLIDRLYLGGEDVFETLHQTLVLVNEKIQRQLGKSDKQQKNS